MTFQMMFAIITPALIVGAFAERMKFSAMLVFMALWLTLCYAPVCHWVWGGGWLGEFGILDSSGGTVVHINAGIAGLAAALALGPRKGYPVTPMPPNNLAYTLVGAGMLWGWLVRVQRGLHAGRGWCGRDGAGGDPALVGRAAALAWMCYEWLRHGKPSVLGIASGAVAGLVAITPASGSVGPMGAIVIGAVSGIVCFMASTSVKRLLGYDDSLDVFGIHCVGGIVGALLTGVFCAASLGGAGFGDGNESIADQMTVQGIGGDRDTCLYVRRELRDSATPEYDDGAARRRRSGRRKASIWPCTTSAATSSEGGRRRRPPAYSTWQSRNASSTAAWMLRLETASPMRKSWKPSPSARGCGLPWSSAF